MFMVVLFCPPGKKEHTKCTDQIDAGQFPAHGGGLCNASRGLQAGGRRVYRMGLTTTKEHTQGES
jgi:hypothetical protein